MELGGTCLHEAVVLDAGLPVIRALLDHGAEVGARDRDGRTPLALAVCLNRDAAAALLRQRGARESDVREADRWVGACFGHHRARADRILSSGAVSLRPADHLWVCRAARGGDSQAAALLLAGGADPCAVDDDGQAALHLAALAGDVTASRSLLAAGADPRALNYAGQTPLDCAVAVDARPARDAVAAVLRDAGASRSTRSFDDPVFAATFERAADAVVDGDVDVLRALLREHPELATARSSRPHRCTLLHYLAANGVEGERQKTPACTSTAGAATGRRRCTKPPSKGTRSWSRNCSRAAPTSACGTPSTTARRPAGPKPAGTRTSQSALPRGPGRSDGRYWTRTSDP